VLQLFSKIKAALFSEVVEARCCFQPFLLFLVRVVYIANEQSMAVLHSAPKLAPFHSQTVAFLLLVCLGHVAAQGTEITVSVDMGEGLIYFLVILFFGLNFCTPVVWFVYVRYLSAIVDRASKEVAKASKRFTERMSDTGRRTAQSIRAE
jgi:hypothetical protein